MKINLAIDANEANVKQRVGSGQYLYHLLHHWHRHSQYNFHLFLKRPPLTDMPLVDSHWHYHLVKPSRFWLQLSLPAYFLLHRPSFHSFFSPAHYSPSRPPSPLVVTIHDLAYEYFPHQFLKTDLYKLKRWTIASVQRAKLVIAVSQHTKQDLVHHYHLDPSKVIVIYNGYDRDRFNARVKLDPTIFQRYSLPRDNFLLYLGTIQPRKNILTLVKAFQLLKKNHQYTGKLVLAGNPGWLSQPILDQIRHSPFSQDIYLPGYIATADLPVLYKLADLYILPSLYEGFGLPVLEAMACGTPVVVSRTSSLPEVAGKAGVYFDPTQPRQLYHSILEALNSHSRLKRLGYLQARRFSWQKTANQTLKVLIQAGNHYN